MDTNTGHDFASLLHAFSLGCLEREDYDLMMEYFKSNQDYPWQELGEYQNLVALLPSFLNIESPDSRVKDMVARKLYRLRDQQRPQRNTQIISPASPLQHKNLFQRIETDEQKLFSQISPPLSPEEVSEPEPESNYDSFEPTNPKINRTSDFEPVSSEKENPILATEKEPEDTTDYSSPFASEKSAKEEAPFSSYSDESTTGSSFSSNFDNIESGSKDTSDSSDYSFESSLSKYPLSGESAAKTDEDFSSFTSETIIDEPAPDEAKEKPEVKQVKSGASTGFVFFMFIVLAGAIGGVYYFLSKDFKTVTQNQHAKYETIVQSLKNELSNTKEIDALLASINLQMVNLKSTPKASGAYGKVLFDSVTRKAMLQVVNLPVLSSDKTYQLWIVSNGQKYSAGLYEVTSSRQYFPIANFGGLALTGSTSFIITEEILAGGEKPSKDVYLAGQIVL